MPPAGHDDPGPTDAASDAWFELAIERETRPFFALVGLPIASARWAERSVPPQDDRAGAAPGFTSLVIRYGDDDAWATVGTWFPRPPREGAPDAYREALVHDDMAFDLGLSAAEPGDGEAYTDQPGLQARIDAAQRQARTSVTPSTLVVDGQAIDALTSTVGHHRRTYVHVPVGGVVFLHACRWNGPVELQRSVDYAAIDRGGW